jgi:phage/plasmid primase-like uncharacterized protein
MSAPAVAVRAPSLGDTIAQFRNAIHAAGIEPPEEIEADGRLHRFSANGKRNDAAGWYVFHADGIPAGAFGDWRTGVSQTWRADIGRRLSPAEESVHRARIQAMQREREAEETQRRAEAREKAAVIWKMAKPATEHPYLTTKGIKSHGLRIHDGALVVPMRDGAELHSLQFISGEGEKRFLTGGRVSGCYFHFPIGKPNGVLCIAEGYATAASIHEATGYAVAVAFNAGNLKPVAETLRGQYPEARIIVCADNDQWTEGNPGCTKAEEAASAVCGQLAVPEFQDTSSRPTDFNDLVRLEGPEAVNRCIKAASALDTQQTEPVEVSAVPSDAEIADTVPANPDADLDTATDLETFGGTVELQGTQAEPVRQIVVGQDPATWPTPNPIQANLHPVPAFDAATLLPESLRAWVMDEADRMPCPLDYIATAAIVSAGAVIGARCAIKPKSRDDWQVIPNIWGGVVGNPAAKKTPSIGVALKPLDRLIARAIEAHREEVEGFQAEKVIFEARKEAIESRIKSAAKNDKKGNLDNLAKELQDHRQQAPQPPTQRRYKTNDTTAEKLGELLRENPTGLLVLRDELVGLIASWEREGREGERAFYLEAWNGNGSFDTDRIGRGSIFIPNLCVSVFGGIQPDKLVGYLEQATHALANDGMLQRFQVLVYPDHRAWEWRDRIPVKQAREVVFNVFKTLADFDPVTWGAYPVDDFAKFPYFRFDDAAQKIFIEWSTDLHTARLPAEDNPIIAQHLAKYDKLFPALALILHLVECAATGQRGQVTEQAALRAAAWCDYLEAHARRCYGLLADDGLRAAQALAHHLRKGKLEYQFTARDVRRHQWRSLTTDKEVQAALDCLEDKGWVRAEEVLPGTQGGRPTTTYLINPRLSERDELA